MTEVVMNVGEHRPDRYRSPRVAIRVHGVQRWIYMSASDTLTVHAENGDEVSLTVETIDLGNPQGAPVTIAEACPDEERDDQH